MSTFKCLATTVRNELDTGLYVRAVHYLGCARYAELQSIALPVWLCISERSALAVRVARPGESASRVNSYMRPLLVTTRSRPH